MNERFSRHSCALSCCQPREGICAALHRPRQIQNATRLASFTVERTKAPVRLHKSIENRQNSISTLQESLFRSMAPRQRSPTPDDQVRTSSPPVSMNRKLIEREESNVSTATSSSSSLTPESETARDNHDIFNLYALLPVIFLTIVNYDWGKVTSELSPESAWTGNYFYEYWSATMLYFIVDLIWVAVVPICVKSPNVIIKHHFIALIYLIGPYLWPHYRWFMGACLTVEVNTWFLIARRVVYKRNLSGTTLASVITACFYISWIIIRCIIYPGILFTFISMAVVGIAETQTILHWELLFLPIHFFLCVLNLKWTYDLFSPIITRWLKSGEERGPTRVSSGL